MGTLELDTAFQITVSYFPDPWADTQGLLFNYYVNAWGAGHYCITTCNGSYTFVLLPLFCSEDNRKELVGLVSREIRTLFYSVPAEVGLLSVSENWSQTSALEISCMFDSL